MDYGVQLYSVRDFTDTDMDYAFSRLAEFGYESVELAKTYGSSPEEINALLAKHGLKLTGAHIPLTDLENNLAETLDFHAKLGNTNIIIPMAELYNDELLKNFISTAKRLTVQVQERGMRLHYHTHGFDYKKNENGTVPIDVIEAETELFIEPDIYWAFIGQRDPAAEIKRLAGRMTFVHLKDGTRDEKPKSLGDGCVPVADCVAAARAAGAAMVVESEGMIPDGLSEVKRCIKYLKKLAAGEVQ